MQPFHHVSNVENEEVDIKGDVTKHTHHYRNKYSEHETREYNTLLATPGSGSISDAKFGAYIRQKWRDVFRK